MSDSPYMALGIPRVVNTALGPVEVRTLSAIELIVVTDQVVAIITKIYKQGVDPTAMMWSLQRLVSDQPTLITGLLSGATRIAAEERHLTHQEIGSLPLDEFLDIVDMFIQQHEKSLARFFAIRSRVESLQAAIPPGRNSPTRSSAAAGPSKTSEDSASNNSNATPDSQPSEDLKIN